MRTRRRSLFSLAALLLLAVTLGGSRCPGTLYSLEEGSGQVEGCIEGPCLCPVSFAPLVGSFRLVELPTLQPGPQRLFEVSRIRWRAGSGELARTIEGRGFYETSAPVLDEQRLVLDLSIDGDPLGRIDSGLVEGGLEFPRIDIGALTEGLCFQSGVVLRSAPIFPGR